MMRLDQERAIWRYLEREVMPRDRFARRTKELCIITKSFFDRFTAEEIPSTLAEWRVAARIRFSSDHPVLVTAEGIRDL